MAYRKKTISSIDYPKVMMYVDILYFCYTYRYYERGDMLLGA